MDATSSIPTDPVELVRQLDAGAIRSRLDALDRERAALLVLLRAAQHARPDDGPISRSGRPAAGEVAR